MFEKLASLLRAFANFFRFCFWLILAGVLVGILVQWLLVPSLDDQRLAKLKSLQKSRNSKAITLIHRKETIAFFGIPIRSYIDIDDAEAILRVIRRAPDDKPIDLIIHTPGGMVLAASQIAHALQQHSGKVTVFIPHYAMSGGTLIALAADAVVMDPNAVLGPVDPQIGMLPAASILKAVEQKPVKEIKDRTLILADVSGKAMDQVKTFVTNLLREKHAPEEANAIAETLTSGQFTHDYPIDVAHVRRMGISVATDMPETIYELMDLYAQEGKGRPSVNYIPSQPDEE
ncbi:MAG: ATP-dependent Clp protease proteolytic subunit [Desulfohalobiaceae bacterium]|nr:ATP-dependent Clp protease proteolytic subunit [Desulfohalobiaceae bacterium]